MTWVEDIGTHLQTNSIGTLGTSIFYQDFDSIANNCVAVIGNAGQSPVTSASGDMKLKRPELQILVRNSDDDTACNLAYTIYGVLDMKVNSTIGSTRFKRIQAISEPFPVSNSKSNLYIYSINFSVEISGD